MAKKARIAPIPFENQGPFEQRLTLICGVTGLRPTQLAKASGLASELVPLWIAQSRSGVVLPGTERSHARLATYAKVPLAWLRSSEPLPLGAVAPVDGAPVVPQRTAVDTMAMADAACDMLTRLDGISPAKAWSLMRGVKLEAPSVLAYYEHARKKLGGK